MSDELTQARERYRFAKQRMSDAAQAAIDGRANAEDLASAALLELNRAQAALRRLTAPAPCDAWQAALPERAHEHD